MLTNLFLNCIMLVAFTFICGHILKEIPEKRINSIPGKIILGVYCGITGILLLTNAINVAGTATILDLRNYAIMMASYFGGFIPTVVSGSIIAIYRVMHFGLNLSSIVAVIRILAYFAVFFLIDKSIRAEWKKWLYKCVFVIILATGTNYLLMINVSNVLSIITEYAVVLVIGGILEFFLLEYVRTSNQLYRRYKKESTRDFLTGLYNTRLFDQKLNFAFEKVKENNEALAFLMIDIDHFKKINDTYGHAAGDMVLKQLSEILMNNARGIDTVARIGGEEFCILLSNCLRDQAYDVALRINKAVENHRFSIGESGYINITVSVGVSVYPETTQNLDLLKETADMALYYAKRNGRNRVCDSGNCIIQK